MRLLSLILVNGVVFASWLFLISAGLTFIYGVLRILNLAHGSLYALGGYMGASLILLYAKTGATPLLSYPILIVAALFIGAVAGLIIEVIFLRRIYHLKEEIQLLVTFSIFLILEDVIKIIWGVDPYFADQPYVLLGMVRLAGVNYAVYSFLLPLVAVASGIFMWWLVNKTRYGKIIVSVTNDREVCLTLGINIRSVCTVSFVIGAILAALGGALTAPMTAIVPGLGVEMIVLAFAVIAIGGMGSVGGAVIGSILVGISRAAAITLYPELEIFVIYLVMSLVLIFRPRGLFGELEMRKI